AAQVPGSSYALVAKAYDAAENMTTSPTVTITIAGGGGGTGPTRHRGMIPQDETWWPSGNPHIIESDVYTGNNVTLTIKPGCIVQFAAGTELYTGYSNPGSIIAIGTPDSMITFTALSDTVPGFWEDVGFYSNTISTARMSYCQVLFGGKGSGDNGAVLVEACNIRLDHTIIRKSGGYGVYVDDNGYFSDFSNNTITGCTKYPVRIDANFARTIGTDNVLTGNAKDGIEVDGGAISTSGTWLNHGVPYVVKSNTYVQDDATLAISAGVTVSMNPGVEFYCGYSSPGSIIAVGTAGSPITFTALTDTVPGIWKGLSFYGQTISTARLSYCIVERAGSSSIEGAVYVYDCRIKMDNCTVRKNAKYGVFCDGGGCFDDFSNNTITASGEYPIGIEADKVRTLGSGNVLTGNTKNGILVDGGNIKTTGTWLNHNVPYVVDGNTYVSDETGNPVLTIAPGTTLRMTPRTEFYVGYGAPGGLIADG
ncbi:MAG: right-handed parallel beta-helix repeat-containing protein, partial [candidate division WOR-3 bacterium]